MFALSNASLTHHWKPPGNTFFCLFMHFNSNSLQIHYLPYLCAGRLVCCVLVSYHIYPNIGLTLHNLNFQENTSTKNVLTSCVILRWPSIFQIIKKQAITYIQADIAVWCVLFCCYTSAQLSCMYQNSSQSRIFFSTSTLWQMYRVLSLSNRKTLLHTCLFASRTHIWLPITGHSSVDVTTICNITTTR